jgi:hypothetical protein
MTVYADKFVDGLAELFCSYGVIRDADVPELRNITPEYIRMQARTCLLPKVIAVSYLSLIARLIGNEQRADLFAEEPEAARIVVTAQTNLCAKVASTTLQAYLPSELTVSKIVELRSHAEEDRLRYQSAIASIVEQVQKVTSVSEVEKIAERAERLARQRIEQTEKKYNQAKVGGIVKLLGVSLGPPGLATFVASALGLGVFMPAAIGAAICLAGAELLSNREKAKNEREATDWSYVFRVIGQ